MAAIAPVSSSSHGRGKPVRVRTAAAQASTGQTDWIMVPAWATYARVTVDLTAAAGNTPILTPTLLTPATPSVPDDGVVINIGGAALTSGYTAAGTAVIAVGPGVSGIANDVALGTTGVNHAYINDVLPSIMGICVTNDRTTGNETYTYTVEVEFR